MTSAPPQPHPYRCENCSKRWKSDCPYYAWINRGGVGITCESYAEFTSIVGCCSHSQHQAAEQRIADVIAKLEILAQEAHNKTFAYPTSEEYRRCAKKEELAYDKSIALLREGK